MKSILLSGLLVLFVASSAVADTADFTDSIFNGVWGQSSHTVDTGRLDLTFESGPAGTTMTHSGRDGVGVNSPGPDDSEVEGNEFLTVTFSGPINLFGITVSDLYAEDGGFETGFFSIDGGPIQGFSATPAQTPDTNGELFIPIDGAAEGFMVYSITFFGSGVPGEEFHISNILYSPNPEPGTMALLGSALAAWQIRRRRRKAAA